MMKPYADDPSRRTRQVVADVAMALWALLWIRIGMAVHGAVMALAAPGQQLEQAGTSWSQQMNAAGDSTSDLPLVGDKVATPFHTVAGVGEEISSAGSSLIGAVQSLAMVAGWITALIPILIVVLIWGLLRLRYARRAGAMLALARIDGGQDALALRALVNQPVRRLLVVSQDPGGGWRRADPEIIDALASLEMRRWGLRIGPPLAD
ncbi:MAG: hypothetical protein ACK5MP_02365 [Nostocoides sp.]